METSRYKNFILGDPILDLLDLHGENLGYIKDDNLPGFDEKLLLSNYIGRNKSTMIKKIKELMGGDCYYLQTAVGKIDILMKTCNVKKYFINGGIATGDGYSMFTVEYSTISLNSKGELVNNGVQKYYKFKNWMMKMQCIRDGFNIDHSFILGRRYKKVKEVVHDGFDFLVENKETYNDLLNSANTHLSNLHEYTIGKDIFPNMKTKTDFPWHNAKKIIANRINEITLVTGCSNRDRNELILQGISSYEDVSNPMVHNTRDIINTECDTLPEDENMLFIDFETVTSVYDDFSTFPKSNGKAYIFNIGLGHIVNGDFSFESYMAEDLQGEFQIVADFVKFIDNLPGGSVTFVHWTDIERRMLKDVLQTYGLTINKIVKWVDLHAYFKKSKVYVRGCYNYKLKFVSRSLHKMGLIRSEWSNSFADGLGAMTAFINYISTTDKDHRILEEIAHYNMIDCRVLWEIYELLISVK